MKPENLSVGTRKFYTIIGLMAITLSVVVVPVYLFLLVDQEARRDALSRQAAYRAIPAPTPPKTPPPIKQSVGSWPRLVDGGAPDHEFATADPFRHALMRPHSVRYVDTQQRPPAPRRAAVSQPTINRVAQSNRKTLQRKLMQAKKLGADLKRVLEKLEAIARKAQKTRYYTVRVCKKVGKRTHCLWKRKRVGHR